MSLSNVDLTDANVLAMYEIRPDGTVNYLDVGGSTDPKLWFNNAKPNGLYSYVIVTEYGYRYTTSLNHVSN